MKSTYNTRRKSVSLTALGVQVPGRSRASTESKSETPNPLSDTRHTESSGSPPSKRVKTSHTPTSPTRSPQRPTSRQHKSSSPTPSAAAADRATTRNKAADNAVPTPEGTRPKSRQLEFTPPPSPPATTDGKIDYDEIKDDIVEGVVMQLEKTGNRPHLIRELAAVLAVANDSVTNSANAPALLSSRLASFIKRSCWSASNPCPVGKELLEVHPRKVFYYLTDRKRQKLPDTSDDIFEPLGITSPAVSTPPVATPTSAGVGVMGPPAQLPLKRAFQNTSPPLSIASAAGDDDSTTNADERRERWAPSPSPEVDLSNYDAQSECGDESTEPAAKRDGGVTSASQSSHSVPGRGRSYKQELEPPRQLHLNTRAQSPRVEGDEREFRDTVFSLRASPTDAKEPPTPVENKMDGVVKEGDDGQAHDTRRLSGYEMDHYANAAHQHGASMSSPAFSAQSTAAFTPKQLPLQSAKVAGVDVLMADDDLGSGLYCWDLNAPKDIDVDELDMLLEGC